MVLDLYVMQSSTWPTWEDYNYLPVIIKFNYKYLRESKMHRGAFSNGSKDCREHEQAWVLLDVAWFKVC